MKANNRKILSAELTLALLIVVIMIFLAFAAPGFYSIQNIMQVMRVFSYTFIAGIGMTMIFITGNKNRNIFSRIFRHNFVNFFNKRTSCINIAYY